MPEKQKICKEFESLLKRHSMKSRRRQARRKLTLKDFSFTNQLLVIEGDKPEVVQPLGWLEAPFSDRIVVQNAKGKEVILCTESIRLTIYKRFLTERESNILARYAFMSNTPKD